MYSFMVWYRDNYHHWPTNEVTPGELEWQTDGKRYTTEAACKKAASEFAGCLVGGDADEEDDDYMPNTGHVIEEVEIYKLQKSFTKFKTRNKTITITTKRKQKVLELAA